MRFPQIARMIGAALVMGAIVLMAGCGKAQIFWSADGTQAAYLAQDHAHVIDANGKVLADLGPSTGGFAWSADGKTLYFVRTANQPGQTTSPASPATATATAPTDESNPLQLAFWQNGKITPLAPLPGIKTVVYLTLSPDGNWIALLQATSEDHLSISAYSIKQNRLRPITAQCGSAVCFTGPHRLAFVEPNHPADKLDDLAGRIVEVNLAEHADHPSRMTLLKAMPSLTAWMQPAGEDLLFTSAPRNFPGTRMSGSGGSKTYNLYHFSRKDKGLTAIAEDVGPLFMPSPDGKRILYEKITAATNDLPEKRELMVMNANGSDSHTLRLLTDDGPPPLWPAWRTSDEITFVPRHEPQHAVQVDDKGRAYLDLQLYRVTLEGNLDPIANLSRDWPDNLKPWYKPQSPASRP